MSIPERHFDWHGFFFSLGIVAFCLLTGAGVQYGVPRFAFHRPAPAAIPFPTIEKKMLTLPTQSNVESVAPEATQRTIDAITIDKVVPPTGKFIAADLVAMKLYLYENGTTTSEYPILSKGRPGTPWETPSGSYSIKTKEPKHFSTIGHVYMPNSMQFYGNYFIHGWAYYPDGTPVSSSFSGGCIRLSTDDSEKVFEFADVGTKVFVYDPKRTSSPPSLALEPIEKPQIAAPAYLVADIDTGDVLAEQAAQESRPVPSLTKFMTALVANETISLDKKLSVQEGQLSIPVDTASTSLKTFFVNDLFYPLLMQSNSSVAYSLSTYYGPQSFVRWMNTTARALDMASTSYAEALGETSENVSTPEDLYRMAVYLTNKKSFVFNIVHTKTKTITADDGSKYEIENLDSSASTSTDENPFISPRAHLNDAQVSVQTFKVGDHARRVAIIVLGSASQALDTSRLSEWVVKAASSETSQSACATCTNIPHYRKIDL